jgi:hypothetical protein
MTDKPQSHEEDVTAKPASSRTEIEGDGNIVGDENVVQLNKAENGAEIHNVTQVAGDAVQGDKVERKVVDNRSGGVYFEQPGPVTINGDVVGGNQTKTER